MLFHQAEKILNKHKKDLCRLGVRTLAVFGSVARNEGSAKSDLDVLVDFDSKKGLFAFVDVKHYLEKLLGCEVDLVTINALHPALKQRILKEAKQVF
ncbi:MAG: nucleotidyltransferase family protein [Rhabdochlamydiaceae bacterium]|nr:nucleotidyltransferase family protein [Rhabdochlamydiaceae bacterium]